MGVMSKMSTYTLEFKESSAKLAAEADQSIAQTARELGINVNTLHGWIGKYHPRKAIDQVKEAGMQEELKRLRKENSRLKQERDILKKAAAYFATEIA